jgi:hypothetical protein
VYGLAVSRSGYGCEDMGWLYLGQVGSVIVWAYCIYFRIAVCGYGQDVCRSGYGCECMGCLYLGQYGGVREWSVCI